MASVEKTYEKMKDDLELEAEEHDGYISQNKLEEIICLRIGKDRRRTIPDTIKQLRAAHIIEPQNQWNYFFMANGWAKKHKERRISLEAALLDKRAEQLLGVRT